MQKEIKIKTKDKKVIYGTLDTPSKPAKSLIIFVHGLGGHQNEHIFFNAAKYFTAKDHSTFRFDLYSSERSGRNLTRSTITDHNQDVNTVVNYFKSKYKNIFLVGHSLGGLSILKANLKSIKSLILWDSTYNLRKVVEEGATFNKSLNAYVLNWGVEILMGKKMVDEWINFPPPKELAKNVSIPMKVICAGKGKLIEAGKEYYENAAGPKEFVLIKNAGHNFNEPGTEEDLFTETYTFIKKFS